MMMMRMTMAMKKMIKTSPSSLSMEARVLAIKSESRLSTSLGDLAIIMGMVMEIGDGVYGDDDDDYWQDHGADHCVSDHGYIDDDGSDLDNKETWLLLDYPPLMRISPS